MKKKIGELNSKPIVTGLENEVTANEIHYSFDNGIITLKTRKSDGKLHSITSNEILPTVITTSLDTNDNLEVLNNDELDLTNTIINNSSEEVIDESKHILLD